MEFCRYYVLRNKLRADGDVDHEDSEKYSLAAARNQYYTWKAAAVTDTTYPQIALALLDFNLEAVEQCVIDTLYPGQSQSSAEEGGSQ